MPSTLLDRRLAVADAAVAILGEEGSRALTHRAIDRRLGLPLGSTGNFFPTREGLLAAAADRIYSTRIAIAELPDLRTLTIDEASILVTARIKQMSTSEARVHGRARLELQLQAIRQPALRKLDRDRRKGFVALAERLLIAIGAPEPARDAPALTAAIDGIVLSFLLLPGNPVPDVPGAVSSILRGFCAPDCSGKGARRRA